MQLAELYNQCKNKVQYIPNFVEGKKEDVEYDIDKIANGYCDSCDNNDECGKDAYLSACLIRYWHMILYYSNKSPNVPIDTIVEWIIDGFLRACKYRGWRKDIKLLKNRRGAEICINNAIDTCRKMFYHESNAQKRAPFFFEGTIVHLDSLEQNEYDQIVSTEQDSYPIENEIIEQLLKNKKYLSSVLVDLIVNTSESKSSKLGTVFRDVKKLSPAYIQYFIERYHVDNVGEFNKSLNKVTAWKLNKSLAELQNNSIILSLRK